MIILFFRSLDIEVNFLLQSGTHYLFSSDFSSLKPELFRRSTANISIKPLTPDSGLVKIVLKTSFFFIFVSKSLTVSNITFIGNDISMKTAATGCSSASKEICCSSTLFLDANSPCYIDKKSIVFITAPEYRGLFNLEFLFDRTDVPLIKIENCQFNEFSSIASSGGFTSISSMAPFSGKMNIYNINVSNSYFPFGFIQFANMLDNFYVGRLGSMVSSEYGVNINNLEEVYEFSNLKFLNYNQYFKEIDYHTSIFYFSESKANILLDSIQFDNIINSNILELKKGSNKGSLHLSNLQLNKLIDVDLLDINTYNNEVSVSSITANDITNTQSFISLNKIDLVKFDGLNITNLKINTDVGALSVTDTNLNLTNSDFENCNVLTIIFQIRLTLTASSLNFVNISFRRSIIYLSNADLIDLKTSYFTGLKTTLSLFYISDSDLLKFTSILVESSSFFSIFYIQKSNQLSIYDLIAKGNVLTIIWKEDQTCDLTFFNNSQIRNNIFSAPLYKNTAVYTSRMIFDQVFIANNNFTSVALISLLAGFIKFEKLLAINNFFLNVRRYEFVFDLEEKANIDFQNSYLENCGVIVKKEFYLAFTDNVYISFWYTSYALIKNNIFVVTKLIELVSGFISGSPTGYRVEIIGNQFITISTNPIFGYKAILLDALKYLRLEDNIFYNSRCNPRTFSHSHGTVYVSGSSSYGYSKNDYVAYINNNTFYNGSCYNGGNLAVISISKVEIKNCYFQNSSSIYFGGSMAIFSIPSLLIANISTVGSVGNEGGAFYFQNLVQSIFTNISVHDVFARKSGGIFIKYAQSLELHLCEGTNTTSLGNGGFMFVFASNINMSDLSIKGSQAKEGGAFFLHGSSNINFENLFISDSVADEAGGISMYDVNKISITNSKMDHLVGLVSGAAVVFGVVKKVSIQNFVVEYAFSKGVGVVFSKTADETAIIEVNNMVCRWTQAQIGSCLYHLSAIPIKITDLRIEGTGVYPLYFQWSFAIQINIQRLQVIGCNVNSNLIFISGVNLNLIDLFFNENNAGDSLIFAESSILSIRNSQFIDNSNSSAFNFDDSVFEIANFEISNPDAYYKLSFLFATNSKGDLQNITLQKLESKNNILIKFDKGSLKLTDIKCQNNVGRLLTLTKTNLNFSSSVLSNISTTDQTANEILYVNDDTNYYYVDIDKTNVTCFQSVSSQFIGRLSVFIRNSLFEFARSIAKSAKTTAISGSNLIELNLINSSFINFTKNAIVLKTDSILNSSLNVISSLFLKNEGSLGGALFLKGSLEIMIKQNIFERNQALKYKVPLSDLEGVGGCIFYQALSNETNFKLFSNNFSVNYASRYLSTVFSQGQTFLDNSNIFNKNSDNGIILSFPVNTRLASGLAGSAINIVSGIAFDLKLELVDIFDRLVYFDNSTIFNSKISNKQAGNTAVIENSIGNTKEGLITFKNFKVKTNPKSKFSIRISGSFSGLQSQSITEGLIQTEYIFYARECYIGEIILSDFSCYKCPKGSYSLIDPMGIEIKYQRCYICPSNADCLGGNIITPHPGYYRKNNISTNVAPCITDACLGPSNETIITSLEIVHGRCREGNSENLCFYCDFGYGRFDKKDYCEKCASIGVQVYARLVFYGFLMIAYIMLNCHFAESFKNKGGKDESNMSTFTKFLVNHSQQVSVILMSSEMPVGSIASFFQASDYISFSNGNAISNDCMMQQIFFEKESFVILKEIFSLVMPIIFCCLSFLIWTMIHYSLSFTNKFSYLFDKIPKTLQQLRKKATLFMVISTFIFYALILKSCFNLFNCIKIDSDDTVTYLKDSPNLQCWGLTHSNYVIFIGLPGIIVWGISFPFFLMFILWKNHNLMSMAAKSGLDEVERKQVTIKQSLRQESTRKNISLRQKKKEEDDDDSPDSARSKKSNKGDDVSKQNQNTTVNNYKTEAAALNSFKPDTQPNIKNTEEMEVIDLTKPNEAAEEKATIPLFLKVNIKNEESNKKKETKVNFTEPKKDKNTLKKEESLQEKKTDGPNIYSFNTMKSELSKEDVNKVITVLKISKVFKSEEEKRKYVAQSLDSLNSSRTFVFFYRDFKNKFYYWESLIFFRKFLITFISTLNETIPIEPKTLLMMIFISVYIHLTGKRWPYKENLCNYLEMISLYALGITVFANLIFNSETYQALKIFFFIATLISNLIFYGITGYKIIIILQTTISKQKTQIMRMTSRVKSIKENPKKI